MNIAERSQSPQRADHQPQHAQAIEIDDLSVEFTTGQRPDGEWFALGTVRAAHLRFDGFPWIVVGTGSTENDAITQLTDELGRATKAPAAH